MWKSNILFIICLRKNLALVLNSSNNAMYYLVNFISILCINEIKVQQEFPLSHGRI